MIRKIKEKFPGNYAILNILNRLQQIQEEERIFKEKKREKLEKETQRIYEKYGKRPESMMATKINKYSNTLNQDFIDSNGYKNNNDREFYNTKNSIYTNKSNKKITYNTNIKNIDTNFDRFQNTPQVYFLPEEKDELLEINKQENKETE